MSEKLLNQEARTATKEVVNRSGADKKPLLRIRNFSKYFPIKKKSIFQKEQQYVRANEDISLEIYEGETLGLVGESGCGKSTLGRTILNLYPHSAGTVTYAGRTIYELQPAYVKETLQNLSRELGEWKKLKEAADRIRENFLKLDEIRQMKQRPAYEERIQEAMRKEAILTQLIGGLILCLPEDEPSLQEAALALYEARIVLANDKEDAVHTADAQKKEAAAMATLNGLRAKYSSHPDFANYEDVREDGLNLEELTKEEMRSLRRDLQIIFQDPYSSLDARMTIGQIIGEGLLTHHFFEKNGEEMQNYIMQVMEECGLDSYFFHRYPHQFSGGQRQRVGIARSLALRPRFIVCDEAVSALDVSIQSQIINLLQDLKEKENLTYLFISHNLSVVKYISDRICVMYLGNVAELAETEAMFEHPMHPYTDALLSAIPVTDDADTNREMKVLEGDIPSPVNPPTGCKFHTRCAYCTEQCRQSVPQLREVEPGHFVACHHPL